MYKTTIEFVQLSKRRNNKVATSSSEYVEASSEQALAFLPFPRYLYLRIFTTIYFYWINLFSNISKKYFESNL